MPPKKKPAKSGYWQFFLECRDKQNQKAGKQMNTGELQSYAGAKWAAMSKEAREPYNQMALYAREQFTNTTSKLTTDGYEIDEIERQEKEVLSKEQEMKNEITKTLKLAHFSSNLPEQVFFIVHINHLTYCNNPDRYFICEIAIAAMSLRNGIEEVFHKEVHPGNLPMGYLGGAMAHSKETHQMIELVNDGHNNTYEVFKDMIDFLKRYTPKHTIPILYADEKILDMTRNVMENFRLDFNYPDEIKVYKLQFLFYTLKNVVAGKNVWPTETFAYRQLEKDLYCYTTNISCSFHEMSDLSVCCSQSIVTRTAYTICDDCCEDLRIELVPGFHVPSNAKVAPVSKMTSRATSVCSGDGFRSYSTRSRTDEGGYLTNEESFPPLRSSDSTASSMVSFSSLQGTSKSTKAASRLEDSFRSFSMKQSAKRDHHGINFPEHGFKNN